MTALALVNEPNYSQEAYTDTIETPLGSVPRHVDEFWTSKQRQMNSLHYSNSYRGCYKPELPEYFISRYTKEGDVVADPFGGRGTTILQAALMNRIGISNDVNPLSEILAYPKVNPVTIEEIAQRLEEIDLTKKVDLSKEEDMSMFYHKDTFRELINLRNYLKTHRDDVDRFIEMTAISRLHGHSNGFFSTYSFPQFSVPKSSQIKINHTRGLEPEYRDIKSRILKKAKTTLKSGGVEELRKIGKLHKFTTNDSRNLKGWEDESVDLVVTSPPFLNQVDYVTDNWIENWFCGIPQSTVEEGIVQTPDLHLWTNFISDTLSELHRVLKKDGLVAMEVGEVKHQGVILNLDEILVNLCFSKEHNMNQFRVKEVFIQSQQFTKLANCFRVKNNELGTNTHRIVLMEKI